MHALTTTSSRGSVRAKLMTTLFVAQVCGSTGHSISLAVGSIMAASITGTNTWSGVPIAVGALGTALASWPLARLMDRAGRRPGLALGYGLAVSGMSRRAPRESAGAIRFGPMIEPSAEPPTMMPIARPRCSGRLTSAAA